MLNQVSTSEYETHFREADQVGAYTAEFAIGSLFTMASTNRQIQFQSLVPYLGSRLQVHWYYVAFLPVGIAGVHLVLFVATVVIEAEKSWKQTRLFAAIMRGPISFYW